MLYWLFKALPLSLCLHLRRFVISIASLVQQRQLSVIFQVTASAFLHKFCTRLDTEPWKMSKLFLQVFPDYLDAGSTGKCVQPVFQTSEISWNNFWIFEGLSKWVPNTTLFKVFLSQSIRQLFLCSWQLNGNRPVADTFVLWLVLAHR